MSVLEKILTFFYPKRCLLCGRAGAVNEDELCADCAKLQPDIHVRFFALHAGRRDYTLAVSYTHLTLPTNSRV